MEVIDGPKPLRDSAIWRLQRKFYQKNGTSVWADGLVPSFVTSNAFVAKSYARIILGAIRDWFQNSATANHNAPINIVEVGAGHARLGFLIVKQLLSLADFFPTECGSKFPFRYIVTDISEKNLKAAEGHEALKPLFDLGVLDSAIFDAENDTELTTRRTKLRLCSETSEGPVILICNYVFDTLSHDAFSVRSGRLQRGYLQIRSNSKIDISSESLENCKFLWSYENFDLEKLTDESQREIARKYLSLGADVSFLLPVGAFQLINNVSIMSRGRFIVLCGDKAHCRYEEQYGIHDPHIAVHGSVSFMVNFVAVQQHIEQLCGWSMVSPYSEGFKCGMFAVGMHKHACPETCFAWEDVMNLFGPENFSTLQRCVKEEIPVPPDCSLKLALSIIRLSNWDSDIFFKYKQVLLDQTPYANEKQQADIYGDIMAIYDGYMVLQPHKDVAFEIGRLLMALNRYTEAIAMFLDSTSQCGEHHVTYYNIGICQFYSGELESAHQSFTKSLRLEPAYRDADAWKKKVEAKTAQSTGSN